ncbi:MAG TPA: tRNA uracil 4-sulfurtransferase ThiI [Acidobacteriota bacterium]|nr:tRNA uracil 4-sulfurtransferase ThiI [Acidobacteriota bacterium]
MDFKYLVHYGELGLKGRNRPQFEERLVANIRYQHPGTTVERRNGRLVVTSPREIDLSNVFGIAWWAPARLIESDPKRIEEEVLEEARRYASTASSFAVRVNRPYKEFPMKTPEIERWLGSRVQELTNLPVNLTHPDLTFHLEITGRTTFLHTRRNPGIRGLPVGVSGRLVGLFSGGVDSVVATYMMARRGAKVELVHFYALHDPQIVHEEKVGELVRLLSHFIPRLRIHYFPYHRFQVTGLAISGPLQRQELVVFRRFMVRVAQKLAQQRKAPGLFTGDSLGQVASQTLPNLRAMDDIAELSIFRPLCGMDKEEIIDYARRIGLFEAATKPYKDCCSLIARNPATVARMSQVLEIEKLIGIDELVERTLEERTTYDVSPEDQQLQSSDA